MAELRIQFHHQMDEIEAKVIHIFALVAEDLSAATAALLDGDPSARDVLAEREEAIDAIYMDVEELVNHQIALQAPMAKDLRFLLSVLRIVPEIERSHDLVVHIANYASADLARDLTPKTRGLVSGMGHVAADMWQRVADSWYRRDAAVAQELDERDDEVDTLHEALLLELASGAMSSPLVITMTLVGRFYERLSDHAVNIARRVAYLAGDLVHTVPQVEAVPPVEGVPAAGPIPPPGGPPAG